MNKSLLDTDTLSEVYKARSKAITMRERQYRAQWSVLSFSSVTVMEIVRGFWPMGMTRRMTQFLDSLSNDEVIAFGADTAQLAGKIEAELLARGIAIGTADTMIAATAVEHGLVLVSGNTAHFERIRQLGFPLRLANWREADS